MDQFENDITRRLRDHAMGYPETSEGASCVNRAFKVRKKNFAFVGEKGEACKVMVKLGPSAPEARRLAVDDPSRFRIGDTDWATIEFTADAHPPVELLTRWVDESFRMLAPKTVVAELDAS